MKQFSLQLRMVPDSPDFRRLQRNFEELVKGVKRKGDGLVENAEEIFDTLVSNH